MSFSQKLKEEALVRSKRTCCICHKFAGRATNVHHIQQEALGGADDIENAIVLCLQCHCEVGHYNPEHPIGNKYSQGEVRKHRDEWWEWCKTHPFALGPDDPLTVSPSVVSVTGGDWDSREIITIYNRTEQTLYAVWVKFELSVGPIAVDELIFDKPDWSEISLPVGTAELMGDCIGMFGPDNSGKENLYVILGRIGPKATLNLSLTIKKGTVVENKRELPVQVLSWDEEPRSLLQRNGTEIAVTIKPPENFTPREYLFYWNKV